MAEISQVFSIKLLICVLFICFHPVIRLSCLGRKVEQSDVANYRFRIEKMFYHAYDNYLANAYPYDELRPLSCDGVDTWGSFSLTLIDALDTLSVMGNYSEFCRVAQLLVDKINFDMNINVSVFETNIRVVGGLLSAHLMYHRAGCQLEPGWPCSGPLLDLAENVARRLLPAFDTETGMPYGTVNLRYGVPVGETPITCTAGVATFIVEFGTLSRLTGNPIFEKVAVQALHSLWNARSSIDLVGNHIDVQTGKWTAVDSGIGAGVDSYYEYLVKGSVLQKPELMLMFNAYRAAISRYVEHDDWYFWVNMQKGQVTLPVFQSLEAYWPGLLTLVGDIDVALKAIYNYHQVWKQFGFTPEFYNIPNAEPNNNREGYPLRPELIESIMYLYKATKDPNLMTMGIDILESIEHSAKTSCGFATVKDVRTHVIEDRLESFFLSETIKYLYLLFDEDNFIHHDGSNGTIIQTSHGECIINTGGYVFNTEAHPIDIAAVYCCSEAKEVDKLLQDFHDNMDLLALVGLDDKDEFLKPIQKSKIVEEVSYEISNDSIGLKESLSDLLSHNDQVKVEIDRSEQFLIDKQVLVESSVIDLGDVNVYDDTVETATDESCSTISESDSSESVCSAKPTFFENRNLKNANTESLLKTETKLTLDLPKFNRAESTLFSVGKNGSELRRKLVMESNFEVLSCPALPFTMRFAVLGEIFGGD
ncbi:ER degradation-enhancing alpha-mannosidase-like protein 1 [Chamberlinius hualienensis]